MYMLTSVTIFALASRTVAWGALGHETVAYIAQNFVTEETKIFCQDTLGNKTDRYLVDVATWADSYRREKGIDSWKRESLILLTLGQEENSVPHFITLMLRTHRHRHAMWTTKETVLQRVALSPH
jgi:hypothetical protein